MLSSLDTKQAVEPQTETDSSSQESDDSHAVLHADLLGIDSPTYKAASAEVGVQPTLFVLTHTMLQSAAA